MTVNTSWRCLPRKLVKSCTSANVTFILTKPFGIFIPTCNPNALMNELYNKAVFHFIALPLLSAEKEFDRGGDVFTSTLIRHFAQTLLGTILEWHVRTFGGISLWHHYTHKREMRMAGNTVQYTRILTTFYQIGTAHVNLAVIKIASLLIIYQISQLLRCTWIINKKYCQMLV